MRDTDTDAADDDPIARLERLGERMARARRAADEVVDLRQAEESVPETDPSPDDTTVAPPG